MPLPYPIERLKNIEDCRTVMKSLLKRGDIATYVRSSPMPCACPAPTMISAWDHMTIPTTH